MRRIILLLCLFALLLAGCSTQSETYVTEVNGVSYTVDTVAGTITGGDITCRYTVSDDKNSITLRFPDGTSMNERRNGDGTISSTGNVTGQYFSVSSVFSDIAWDTIQPRINGAMLLAAVASLGIGVYTVRNPYGWWRFSRGWMVKNVEPSDALLACYRITGAVIILASVIMFIISLGS